RNVPGVQTCALPILMYFYFISSTFTCFFNIWWLISRLEIMRKIFRRFFRQWFILTGFSVHGYIFLFNLRLFFSLFFVHAFSPSICMFIHNCIHHYSIYFFFLLHNKTVYILYIVNDSVIFLFRVHEK